MSMIKEFKEFAMRGNVIDLAVGVVIGAAFGAIVTSLVADVVMPVIGMLTSGVDFSHAGIVLKEASTDAAGKPVAAVVIAYGKFINTLINFVIIAFVIFIVVKGINSMKKKEAAAPAAPAAPTTDQQLLMEIRDLLKSRAP